MDFNATVDLVIKDLNEAREIIDDLKNYPGIPLLQIELAKAKCKSAAEVIALLKDVRYFAPASENKIQTRNDQDAVIKKVPEKQPEDRPKSVTGKEMPGKRSGRNSGKAIIADSFSHLSGSLNEQLGSFRNEDDVSERVNTKPITNLSDAIGVNDKFLFIREIFNGNPEQYNQAISRLNVAETLVDAKKILLTYTGDTKESHASKQLLDLIKRKYLPDE